MSDATITAEPSGDVACECCDLQPQDWERMSIRVPDRDVWRWIDLDRNQARAAFSELARRLCPSINEHENVQGVVHGYTFPVRQDETTEVSFDGQSPGLNADRAIDVAAALVSQAYVNDTDR